MTSLQRGRDRVILEFSTGNSMLLIVDDDPTFLERAEELLDGVGRGIFFARNAEHARELMGTVGDGFSVVMIDLDLPGQDGFSLIAEMRRRFPTLPVIAISGVVQKHVLESAKLLGAADTLQKPIGPEWTSTIARVRSACAH
jgi:two-component system, response regulator AauR